MKLYIVIWLLQCFSRINTKTHSTIINEFILGQESYVSIGPFGNHRTGHYFTDFRSNEKGQPLPPRSWPSSINIRHGKRIDGIQIFYGSEAGEFHGDDQSGTLTKLRLYDGDKIIKIVGRAGVGLGAAIDSLEFITLNGRKLGPYGSEGGQPFEVYYKNCYLALISGRANRRLDSLSFIMKCENSFEDNNTSIMSSIERLRGISGSCDSTYMFKTPWLLILLFFFLIF